MTLIERLKEHAKYPEPTETYTIVHLPLSEVTEIIQTLERKEDDVSFLTNISDNAINKVEEMKVKLARQQKLLDEANKLFREALDYSVPDSWKIKESEWRTKLAELERMNDGAS